MGGWLNVSKIGTTCGVALEGLQGRDLRIVHGYKRLGKKKRTMSVWTIDSIVNTNCEK
jgi:hypothetical protein